MDLIQSEVPWVFNSMASSKPQPYAGVPAEGTEVTQLK